MRRAQGRAWTHVGHVRRERGAVQRRLGLERLEHGERLGVVYARRLVLAARDEVRAVGRELQVRDDVHVRALVREHLLARARVEERDFARLVARQDQPWRVRERAHGRFAPDWVEERRRLEALCGSGGGGRRGGQDGEAGKKNKFGGWGLRTLCAVAVAVDVEDADGALVAHALLGDADHLRVVVGKGYALDGSRELPHEEALSRLHGPEAHLVVRRARDEEV